MGSDVNGNGTEGGHRASTGDDEPLYSQLAELWQGHHRKDLETRHRTGVLLNKRLGLPGEAQAYGQEVLKRVGKECRIAQSDLSRMRWFARLFDNLEGFQQAHPGVNSWTDVKELLPDLKPRKGGETGGQTATLSRTTTGGVTRSLTGLIKKLRGMESIPKGGPGKALRGKLRELIEVARRCLADRASSPASETDSSPGLPARADADGR
jgi:hypothetical protein